MARKFIIILAFSLILTLACDLNARNEGKDRPSFIAEIESAFQKEPTKEDHYDHYSIQSFGWKCNKVTDRDTVYYRTGDYNLTVNIVQKLKCANDKIYYKKYRTTRNGTSGFTYCHKDICKAN